MPSLFLSHSSADKTFVEKLAKDLEGVGVNVWFDKWEIKVGDSLTGKIEEGLQANDYLGLVLSPAAVASEWVKAELSAAWCRQMSSRKIVVCLFCIRIARSHSFSRIESMQIFARAMMRALWRFVRLLG